MRPISTRRRNGMAVGLSPVQLTSSGHCNFGLKDADTSASLGYHLRLGPGDVWYTGFAYKDNIVNISARASTYSEPGWSTINIYNDKMTIAR